jgi:hypothetical protein
LVAPGSVISTTPEADPANGTWIWECYEYNALRLRKEVIAHPLGESAFLRDGEEDLVSEVGRGDFGGNSVDEA